MKTAEERADALIALVGHDCGPRELLTLLFEETEQETRNHIAKCLLIHSRNHGIGYYNGFGLNSIAADIRGSVDYFK